MTKQNEILTHERKKKNGYNDKVLKKKGISLQEQKKKINTILPDIHCEYPL